MSRVKRGVTARRHHKKIIELTKGHKGQRHRLFRRANESLLHAMDYSTRDRYKRKGDFRRLWIVRINAAIRPHGLSYSQFIHGLNLAGVSVDRKVMADLAVRDEAAFGALATTAKAALA
ncbi:MAG TPA: 50S ribosomal protein L20 [Dehalococcoidia bacterium]|jgi:large subunit ribosomal protein L20|nr:50S ribosomal protein L20 [Dehalococcoidia bacterium]